MRISHRDYDPKNTVIVDDERLFVADWDHAGPVQAEAELIVAATSFGTTDTDFRAFVTAYRDAGGDAPRADSHSLAAEAADVDWLLRNVEACLSPTSPGTPEQHQTAASLIASYPANLDTLRAWPAQFSAMLR